MIRVGVVRGGTGNHYEESLASGAFLISNLPKNLYQVIDIFIDKNGVWHIGGLPTRHETLKSKVDVVWNALHGFYGEDGKLTQLLENMGIPHTGSNMLSSAILSNYKLAKEHFLNLGIKTQNAIYVEDWGDGDIEESVLSVTKKVFSKYSPPWKVVPISKIYGHEGDICKTQVELARLLEEMCKNKIPTMIEEVVFGTEAEVIVAPGFRKQDEYAFLPVDSNSYQNKLKKEEKNRIAEIARKIHADLHLGGYSKAKVCITKKGEVYLCGVDTIPEMHEKSLIHHCFDQVGSSFEEFAEHMINHALNKQY